MKVTIFSVCYTTERQYFGCQVYNRVKSHLVDINLGLSRGFQEGTIPVPSQVLSLVFANHSLILQITLVADQNHRNLQQKVQLSWSEPGLRKSKPEMEDAHHQYL